MAEPVPSKPEDLGTGAERTDTKVGHWQPPPKEKIREIGGRKDGPEPTRYGDWEKNGRCIDF
jgi:hypothetical protein